MEATGLFSPSFFQTFPRNVTFGFNHATPVTGLIDIGKWQSTSVDSSGHALVGKDEKGNATLRPARAVSDTGVRSHCIITVALLVALLLLFAPVTAVPGTADSAIPAIDGIAIFPSDHIWNVPVDTLPVDDRSADYVSRIGTTRYLHPDFGSGLWEGRPIGIPFNIVDSSVIKQAVSFDYGDESDYGPYPIPSNPLIEGGSGSDGDRHLLIIHKDEHVLYELYAAGQQSDGSWHAGSGAIFGLNGYSLRPDGWTSADAAGLAILPGLVRYEEVAAGEITHAVRFTAPKTRRAYVWPARHYASSITDASYPPMGQRFRLKSSFDTSGYPKQARIVLEALKKYGMILSDNGAAWYISGAPDDRWDNDDLHTLQNVKGSDFEAVDVSSLIIDPASGQAQVLQRRPDGVPGTPSFPTDSGKGNSTIHTGNPAEPADGDGFHSFLDFPLWGKSILAFFDRNGDGRVDGNDLLRLFFPG